MRKRFTIITIFSILLSCLGIFAQKGISSKEVYIDKELLPDKFKEAIESIKYDLLGEERGESFIKIVDKNTLHIRVVFSLLDDVRQNDWQLSLTSAFSPSFHWAPHLTPSESNIIDQHVFRSPALIMSDTRQVVMIIPDLDILHKGISPRWYMDMNAVDNSMTLGMSKSKVAEHVLFEREEGAVFNKGELEMGFYLFYSDNEEDVQNPFRKSLDFLWSNWGSKEYRDGNPVNTNLEKYVEHTYNWAFNNWADNVWQEFELNGKRVGAPVFIVNTTQSPNYHGEINEREFRSVWNQAWFNSLRSASGLYRYARRTSDDLLLKKANMTKELALSFPKNHGFFPALIGTEMHEVNASNSSEKYNRSKGWNTYYWGNSNRNPYTWDPAKSPLHILDMSWTALLMLRWYNDLEKDQRLLNYAEDYAQSLLKVQFLDGFFPGWLCKDTLMPMEHLNDSPETSMSVTFLLELFELTENKSYKEAALRAIDVVIDRVVPDGRWEDFETYWSCSRLGSLDWVGRKVERNNMYKQNNFSMFWTAEALLKCYQQTENKRYLEIGQRVLDEMLMTQASWQPPYMYVNVLGGFGVLNADGEWNDSRASLFAELILQYGKTLNKREYIERGYAALKSSFVMMYCPENPQTKSQWEKVYPFFNHKDYGFTMENYGHGGTTSLEGEGMGEFTIYDWGNGAAAEAYNRILDNIGEIE